MVRLLLISLSVIVSNTSLSQADIEIQVYASPTIQLKRTIVELHSNYTFKGSKYLANTKDARWVNETLEITTGIAKNMELGFYTFTGLNPNGGYEYLGSLRYAQELQFLLSINGLLEQAFLLNLDFFRPDASTEFFWQGEIRPIIDKIIHNWYFSFNPNVDFVLSGPNKEWGFAPQFKTVYTFNQKLGIGFEYYGGLGTFRKIAPINFQEHLIGPMIDLYTNPQWEVNGGSYLD